MKNQYLVKIYNNPARTSDAILIQADSITQARAIALGKLFNPDDIFGGWGFDYTINEIILLGKAV